MRPFGSVRASTDRVRRRLASPVRVALVTLAGALVLSGCSSEELPRLGMPEPITNQGPRILLLWQSAWGAALIVGGLVWGMIIWASIAYRRRHADDPLPKQTRYNLPIEVFYTVVPLIIVAVFFFYTARDETEITRVSDNPEVSINVNAFQWSWQFNYTDADVSVTGSPGLPPTLVLPKGKLVQFKLTSEDVIHSFWVPAFLYKLDVVPGHPNTFEVVPEKLGTYVGKCAELCGVDHSRMLFNVKIVEPAQYDQYLADLKAGSAK